jgi:predicted ATP-binding protein involved in virulence
MKLNKLVIDNFRCFKHYEINFASGTTILFGKNGSGKSSLIHALHYALSFLFTNDRSMGDDFLSAGNPDLKVISTMPSDFYQEKGISSGELNIQGYAIINGESNIWNMYKRSTSGSSWNPSKYINAYRAFMDAYKGTNSLPLLAYYSDSFPHKDIRISKFAQKQIIEPLRNFGYYQWDNETSCTRIWEIRFINTLYSPDTESKFAEINFINGILRRVSTPINEGADNSFSIEKLYPQLIPDGDGNQSPILFLEFTNKSKASIAFQNLPAGYKRIYSIALDIAYRAYILNGPMNDIEGIVFIDEIDLHLHPSLEQEILQRLQTTFPMIQFIVSTHSPLVLQNLDLDRNRNSILKMEMNKEEPIRMRDIYGIDANATITDIMDVPYTNTEINDLSDSILRLFRMGKTELANERKLELKEKVSPERYKEIISNIEKSI